MTKSCTKMETSSLLIKCLRWTNSTSTIHSFNTIESIDYKFNLSSMAVRTTGNIKNGASPAVYIELSPASKSSKTSSLNFTLLNTVKYHKTENGYLTLSLGHADQLTRTVAQVTLTEGVTPTEVDATVTVVQTSSSSVRYASYYFWLSSEDFSYF